jgi:hypothetical protein
MISELVGPEMDIYFLLLYSILGTRAGIRVREPGPGNRRAS